MPGSIPVQPRAFGTGRLSVRLDETGQSRLGDLRQSGSSKLVFPRNAGPSVEMVLVNTAGGITGGDQFDLDIHLQKSAALTVTTQAAERAYRAQRGEVGRVTTKLTVETGASLNWLPQELILFDRCALQRRLDIFLEQKARLLMVEAIVFGRAAMHETLRDVMFRDRISITRNGAPLYVDGFDLIGNAAQHLARPTIANGAGAMGSVVMVGDTVARQLAPLRALLPPTAGASLIGDDVLVIRLLASDSFELRRSLVPVLEYLSDTPLPKSWNL